MLGGEPVCDWFVHLDKGVRKDGFARTWYIDMAVGHGSELNGVLHRLMTPHKRLPYLRALGLVVDVDDLPLSVLTGPSNAEFVEQQQSLMQRLWKHVWEVVQQMTLHFAYTFLSYPGRFARLLHSDAVIVERSLEHARETWSAWCEVKGSKTGPWSRLCERTPLQLPVVAEIFAALEANGWQMSATITVCISRLFDNQGSSLSSELAFQAIQDCQRASKNGDVSLARCWRTCTAKRTLSQMMKYTEVETDIAVSGGAQVIPKTFFRPQISKADDKYQDLPGRKKPSWYSPSPLTGMRTAGDEEFLRQCSVDKCMDRTACGWQSQLIRPGMLIVAPDKCIYWCVATTETLVGLWPAVEVKLKFEVCFHMADPGPELPLWRMVVDISSFSVMPVEMLSPAQALILGKGAVPTRWEEVTAMRSGDIESVMMHHAKHGFRDIAASQYPRISKLVKTEWSKQNSVHDNLLTMIAAVTGASESECLKYISCRLHHLEDNSAYADLLESEGASNLMDATEEKQARSCANEMREKIKDAAVLRTLLVNRVSKASGKTSHSAASKRDQKN
eukprot:6456647-Amphidinium_carterae.3